ncbi:hypothetical protein [Mycetocola zhujimingii]|uniref:Uncharacterized protein n=1 Tax=Mycetocola zhujimingii TaxID=2079792 RepID=A0A2U1TFA0_9MICO|nr:hypothetical protein [Mycetocola zhujimingii]AWB85679.1 hypothetical protein C3E77_02930 [Mycetocola zhujimingii]PWC07578.1 hypothetical protein DF223_05965 [Mycetocola zhujimingii]
MKKIHYAGATFVTGDVIARALIAYAHALVETNMSDVVELPISRRDGSAGRVELLLVPSAGMLFESEPTLVRDVVSEAVVGDLRRRVAMLASHTAVVSRPPVTTWEVRAASESPLYSDVHTFA